MSVGLQPPPHSLPSRLQWKLVSDRLCLGYKHLLANWYKNGHIPRGLGCSPFTCCSCTCMKGQCHSRLMPKVNPWTQAIRILQSTSWMGSVLNQAWDVIPKGADCLLYPWYIPLPAHVEGRCWFNTAGQSPHIKRITHHWKAASLLHHASNKSPQFWL